MKKERGGRVQVALHTCAELCIKKCNKSNFFHFPWNVSCSRENLKCYFSKKRCLREEILVILLWILLLFLSMNYFSLHFKILFNREVLFLWQRCEKLRLKNEVIWSPWHTSEAIKRKASAFCSSAGIQAWHIFHVQSYTV